MTKSYTTQAIAEALDGTLTGRGDIIIDRIAHPADIRGANDLALATDKKLLPLLAGTAARAAIISAESKPEGLDATITVKRPRLAMAKLTSLFAIPVSVPLGVHPTAIVENGAKIGAHVTIGAHSYIGAGAAIGANSILHPQTYVGPDAMIGESALIYPGVKIGARVQIGARCIIHFNASIGADGFSFVTPQPGSVEAAKSTSSGNVTATNQELVRIASLGHVIIGDDVEIGAHTAIDRGTIAATRIGNGTKIDNHVQIGHNVSIGENCLICGKVGIAGSVVIGNRVVLGGASGIADQVKISDDAIIMAMSAVGSNVAPKTIVGGIPALPRERAMENHMNIGRIKGLIRKIEELTARVEGLEKKGSN